ncbi:MAG: ParB/RepB/Spo0J family partition protein [Pseudomonadota bacterium]
MTLQHINIEDLSVSPLNVRKYGAKDCADLVTSIRAMGVLQPLLVREAEGGFEVIAGQRRLNACRIIAEDGDFEPLPCLIMAEGDDATAIEASLAENIERLPMDEVDQYKAFAKLIKEGREPADIATTFGITERMVSQRLSLGRLHAPILTAYRKGDIHARDIRTLTMATPKQQKAWWALVKDDDAYLPTGQRLKDWLFGGAHIPVSNAIFDVEASGLAVVSDLFGDDAFFADADAFWAWQNSALTETMAHYLKAGWVDVIALDVGAYFATWDHRTTCKADGGKVFITTSTQGEVTFHEGYITNAEATRREKAEHGETAKPKPELTKAARNYVDLHRHAAVRVDLLGNSGIAIRLVVAHMLVGSDLWTVREEQQSAAKPEIAESVENSAAQKAFNTAREAAAQLLGFENGDAFDGYLTLSNIFKRLMDANDQQIMQVITFLMADTLSVQNPLIDVLAVTMGTDMAQHWTPEPLFFDLVKDKPALNAMVGEYAGENAAREHITATGKTQRAILNACLDGTRTPAKPDWMPAYMAFPMGSYLVETAAAVEAEDIVADGDVADVGTKGSDIEQAKAA